MSPIEVCVKIKMLKKYKKGDKQVKDGELSKIREFPLIDQTLPVCVQYIFLHHTVQSPKSRQNINISSLDNVM